LARITEGKLRAIDISGANNLTNRRCVRIPIAAWETFIRSNPI